MATASALSNTFSQPGALISENFADVLDARMAFVKRRAWNQPIVGLKYYDVRNTNRAYEKHSYIAGGEIVPRSADTDAVPQSTAVQGFDNTYTMQEYRLGVRLARKLIETDQFSVIDKHMEDLNVSARDTIELYAALPFNTTFGSTVDWVCADGMLLCDSARNSEDPAAGSWSNLETAAAMSQATIATMRLNFYKTVNERGRKRPIIMKDMIIPSDLQDTIITQLKSAQKPGTALNDMNFNTQYGLSYDVWPYLTSTTAFFGVGNGTNELVWYWRVKPGILNYDSGNPDVMAYRLRMSFVSGADRPTNLRGNAGA